MTKRLPKKSKIAIIFDTSCLYTHSDHISSTIIDKALAFKNRLSIEIYLPEIVLMELKNHCKERIKDKHEKITASSDSINKILNRKLNRYKSSTENERALNRSVEKWVREKEIKILTTPFDELDVKEIADVAINKESVFKEKNSDSFKDYLIFKTVEHYIDDIKYKSNIFFVAHDKALSEEVHKLFQKKNREVLYTEEELLLERLASVADNISQKMFDKIKIHANLMFFDAENKKGFWYDMVMPNIKENYTKEINDPHEGVTEPYYFRTIFSDNWIPLDNGMFYIGPTTIVDTKLNGNKYPFQTKITYRQKFQKEVPPLPSLSSTSGQYNLPQGNELAEMLGAALAQAKQQTIRPRDEVQHTMEIVFVCKWTAKNPSGLKLVEPELQSVKITEKAPPPSSRN